MGEEGHGVTAPRVEGTVGVGGGRRLGFAEFGPPSGRSVVWLHGTPGARRQIPSEARAYAEEHGLRIVGIDRPGIGSSSPHVYGSIVDFTDDLEVVADRLGLDELAVIGLSGGGLHALASGPRSPASGEGGRRPGRRCPHGRPRRHLGQHRLARQDAVAVHQGGPGAHRHRPHRCHPRGEAVGLAGARRVRPTVSPPGDRALLARPEFKAMFLDDLLNGSRKQISAPMSDVLLFSRHWGFELADVQVPVRWWHGDADHIIPYAHGVHMVSRLPNAELRTLPGESHLGGLGFGEEILSTLLPVPSALLSLARTPRTLDFVPEAGGEGTVRSSVGGGEPARRRTCGQPSTGRVRGRDPLRPQHPRSPRLGPHRDRPARRVVHPALVGRPHHRPLLPGVPQPHHADHRREGEPRGAHRAGRDPRRARGSVHAPPRRVRAGLHRRAHQAPHRPGRPARGQEQPRSPGPAHPLHRRVHRRRLGRPRHPGAEQHRHAAHHALPGHEDRPDQLPP